LEDIFDILLDEEHPNFFGYITYNHMLSFRQVHVFAMKKPSGTKRMARVLYEQSKRNKQAQKEAEEHPSYESNGRAGALSAGGDSTVFHAQFLGDAAVATKKWWKENGKALAMVPAAQKVAGGRSVDDMFEAAGAVGRAVVAHKLNGQILGKL
jgi:hypothetical protein